MVHADIRAREEEGDPGHVDAGAGPLATFLQLPPVERPEDCLQKVARKETSAFYHLPYT